MENSVHLVVLIHGLTGAADDLAEVEKLFQKMIPQSESKNQIHILNCSSNEGHFRTIDGIENGSARLFNEINATMKKVHVSEISFIGHSLGGLYARYIIGMLESDKVFDQVKPHTYISIASPHAGSRRPWRSTWQYVLNICSSYFLGKTGAQLMLEDNPSSPLLVEMADPNKHFIFGLKRFSRRIFYACVCNDFQVNFCTASLNSRNFFLEEKVSATIWSHKHFPMLVVPEEKKKELPPQTQENFSEKRDLSAHLPNKYQEKSLSSQSTSGIDNPAILQIVNGLRTLEWEENFVFSDSVFVHDGMIGKPKLLASFSDDVIRHIVHQFIPHNSLLEKLQ